MGKLAIITTHPIQYYAPIFQILSRQITLKVFYTIGNSKAEQFDKGFQKSVNWDIPLLEGYEYTFLSNISSTPSTARHAGIDNPTIVSEIQDWHPDYLMIIGWNFKGHLKAMRYFKGKIPVYFRGDSTFLYKTYFLKSLVRKIVLRNVFKHIDQAFYVGQHNKKYYLMSGLRESQLSFAPHAIDNERFINVSLNNEPKAMLWREELGINATDLVFLFVGKFQAIKNPLLLLNSFKKLQKTNLHLIFVGNGELETKLKISAVGHKNIHFLPFQNQSVMPTVYKLGDVFILPSISETWGLSVNEAMACGLPILVSDRVGCAIDLISPGMNGFIFQSNNERDLIEKLNIYASISKSKLKTMGSESLKKISSWSFQKIVDSISSKITDDDKK